MLQPADVLGCDARPSEVLSPALGSLYHPSAWSSDFWQTDTRVSENTYTNCHTRAPWRAPLILPYTLTVVGIMAAHQHHSQGLSQWQVRLTSLASILLLLMPQCLLRGTLIAPH
jgi:hypothetical protein